MPSPAIHAAMVGMYSRQLRSSTTRTQSSPEDIAKRRAEQEKWEKEEKARLEKEAQTENKRAAIFNAHIDLIKTADELKTDELCERIYKLERFEVPTGRYRKLKDNTFNGMPSYDHKNILQIIFNRPNLTAKKRYELMNHLGKIGYEDYYKFIFIETNPENTLDFLSYWMSLAENTQQIRDICEKSIAESCLSDDNLIYRTAIKKIAQIRDIEAVKNGKENNDPEIENFLASTEPPFFSCFRRHYSSYDIYKMFRDKQPDAEQQFIAKCSRAENRINRGLTTEEHRSHFSFRTAETAPTSAEDAKPSTPKIR